MNEIIKNTQNAKNASNQMVTAKNAKNQSKVNKACSWLIKHNEANRLRDLESDTNGDETTKYRQLDRKCETTFDKYLDYCYDLPKYEVKNIEKSDLY